VNHANGSRKIAIPGNAGEAIAAALNRMALHQGDCEAVIIKKREAGGRYVYRIAFNPTPATPG